MKEIACISSHPTIKLHIDETLKTFKEALKLNIDVMYVSHYEKVPQYIQDNASHIYIDKYNPIIGFNTPKKYNFIAKTLEKGDWFTNGEVCPSNTFAHYLNLKNSIQISRMLGYDVYYAIVHDIAHFFNEENFDICYYPLKNNISGRDIICYPMTYNILSIDSEKHITKNIFDTKLFAINLRSRLVDSFFNISTLEEFSKLHSKWVPFLKEKYNIERVFPCTFLEVLMTLECIGYNYEVLGQEIGDGSCGYFDTIMGINPKKSKLESTTEDTINVPELQNIGKWREKLGVKNLD